jgi:hypothetical protein
MFTEEFRRSETKNRTATIKPKTAYHQLDTRYNIVLYERGRLISRERQVRTTSLHAARKVARECV